MTTAITGNRMMGFTMGMALLMMGLVLTLRGMALPQTGWAKPQPAGVSPVAQLDIRTEATPDPVEVLDRVTVTTTFRASTEIQEPLAAQLEVVGAAQQGNPVLVMKQSGFRVPADGARAVYWEWRVPESVSPGEYILRVKVVGADSGRLYGEEQQAGTLTVQAR